MSIEKNSEWKVSQAEFAGYVRGKLEDYDRKFDILFNKLDIVTNRIGENAKDISALKVKSGIFGFLGGSIVGGLIILKSIIMGR